MQIQTPKPFIWTALVLTLSLTLGWSIAIGAPPEQRGSVRLQQQATDTSPKSIQDIYGKSYAVVIGIDNYAYMPKLGGAVRDAKAIAKLLKSRGFEISLILDKKATEKAIKRAVTTWLAKKAKANDRVIIYFSGHGVSKGQGSFSPPLGFMMPVDAQDAEIDGIGMDWLQRILRTHVMAKHVMYIADACYSGLALTRSGKSSTR
jgi:uncharacterized caspase-like protein